jgi:hypothetical protein
MEDFSLIILCRGRRHLLAPTLDTLKPQTGSFEVLLLAPDASLRLKELVDHYPNLKIKIQNTSTSNVAEMMNEGLKLSQGKYIQFLEPGDRYISQHGLEFISSLIPQEPHIIYSHSLTKSGVIHADPITARAPWFLRSKLFELGGFDRRLHSCPSLDILCKLSRDQKTRSILCGRVVVDSEAPIIPLRETCRVLYRHFGLFHALKWVFSHDRSQWLQRITTFIKEAFWRAEN